MSARTSCPARGEDQSGARGWAEAWAEDGVGPGARSRGMRCTCSVPEQFDCFCFIRRDLERLCRYVLRGIAEAIRLK